MASVTITVLGNTRQVTTSFDQLNERVAALRSEVLSTSTATSLFGGALVPIAASATSLALTLGAAAGAVGVFGAAVKPQFTAIQQASAAADKAQQAEANASRKQAEAHALAAQGGKAYKTALSEAAAASRQAADAQAAYKQQLAGMPPTTASVAMGFVKLKADFKAWSDNLAPHTMPVFLSGLHVIDGLLPKLAPLAANVGDQFAALGKKLEHAADSPAVDSMITKFSDFAAHALADVIKGVEELAGWLARGFQSQGFHDFLAQGKQDGPQIVQMLKTLVEFIGKFIHASQGMDQIEFKALALVVNLLNKIPQNVLNILAPTILGIAAAVKIWAIAQGLLNIALADNPIGAVIIGLTALGILLYQAYKHSEAFRKVVDALAWGLGDELLGAIKNFTPILKQFADMAMAAFGVLIHSAATAFGWIPGIGGKLKGAAKNFDEFSAGVDSMFNQITVKAGQFQDSLDQAMKERTLKVQITDWQKNLQTAVSQLNSVPASKRADLLANIADLQQKIAKAQALLASMHDKIVTITYHGVANGVTPPPGFGYQSTTGFSYAAGGAVTAAASGGGRSGMVLVGEQGPELVRLPGGSSVIPAGQSAAMLGASGGVQRLELEWVGGNAGDEFMRWLRENIRVRGGNVQTVLGQGY